MISCHVVGCKFEPEEDIYVRIPHFPFKAFYCRKHSTVINDLRDRWPYELSDKVRRQKEHETRNILEALLE